MSTYYYLFCKKCKQRCDFVGVWFPARWGWMAGTIEKIPGFIAKHNEHLEEIEIVNQHDSRIYDDDVVDFCDEEEE